MSVFERFVQSGCRTQLEKILYIRFICIDTKMKIAYFITLLNLFTQVQASYLNSSSLEDPDKPKRIACTSTMQQNIRLKEFKNNDIKWRTQSNLSTTDCYKGGCATKFTSDWTEMNTEYPGIIENFCTMVTDKIYSLEDDIAQCSSQYGEETCPIWVGQPTTWRNTIVKRLNELSDPGNGDSRCSIAQTDPAINAYVDSLSYWKAQRLRMDAAKISMITLKTSLAVQVQHYETTRLKLEKDMGNSNTMLSSKVDEFKLKVKNGDFDAGTEALLETGADGARGIVERMRETIAKSASKLEEYAHKIKRDSIRLAKMNQIANEHDRLQVFYNRIVEGGYQMLRNCLLNYQIEQAVLD